MTNINFSDLNLSSTNQVTFTSFVFNGLNVEVLDYLPTEDKYDLVMIALQKADENGIYNPIKLETFFHLNVVYMYTNLVFSDEERANESITYDTLVRSGLLDNIIKNIDETEWNTLHKYLEETKEELDTHRNTAAAVIQTIINDLPKNAALAADIVQNFDPAKYQAVVDFATAANGGRPINAPALSVVE